MSLLRRRRLLVLLPALLPLAAGCGFQLRGSNPRVAPAFTDLRLRLAQPEPGFERQLRRRLEVAGIRPHNADDEAARGHPLLAIGAEAFSGRPASTTVLARSAQVTLRLAIRIDLAAGGELLIDAETLSVERTHYQDLRNIAGNREEAELLREEMRRELIERIPRRLAALAR